MVYTLGHKRRSAMPWKECDKMSERMKFIGRLLEGEKMTDICAEFGISRVTGYNIWNRYEAEGLKALQERSRRPQRLGNQTPAHIEKSILQLKKKYPTWSAPKILCKLQRKNLNVKMPVRSTVHAILDRSGLVKKKLSRRRFKSVGTGLTEGTSSNVVWCTDFKGQFRMKDHKLCYPLTITDHYSRYLITAYRLRALDFLV